MSILKDKWKVQQKNCIVDLDMTGVVVYQAISADYSIYHEKSMPSSLNQSWVHIIILLVHENNVR